MMRSKLWPARARVWLAVFALAFCPKAVRAADTEGARLFREGRALMLDGRFAEACPKLETSQRLEPHVGTLLNLAACHEKQEKFGSAWVEYQKALTSARAEGQSERASLAESRISAIESRVPWLTITADSFEGTVMLDGAAIEKVALGTAMPVDPGPHVVRAERNGHLAFESRIDLAVSERATVRVTADTAEWAPPPPKEPVIVAPKPEAATTKPLEKNLPTKPGRGAWVLEMGAFTGYIGGSGARGRLVEPGSVVLSSTQSAGSPATCATLTCSEAPIGSGGSGALGLTVLGGYAPSESLTLGVRILAAPAVGSRGAWAFGPTVVLHPSEGWSVGLWGLFGDASQAGNVQVTPPSGYNLALTDLFGSGALAKAEGTLAGGFGAGLDVSVRLFEVGRSTFLASTTPFFIVGNSGSAFVVPIGMAMRFQ